MKRIDKYENSFDRLRFFGDLHENSENFLIHSNSSIKDLEYLFFFDSRGYSKSDADSVVCKLTSKFGSANYLAISRPLELTTWATLYNFFQLNDIPRGVKVITGIGLVDFTPKKQVLCENMISQIRFGIPEDTSSFEEIDRWRLSNGNIEPLFTCVYSEMFKEHLLALFENYKFLVINTPIVSPAIRIDRARPASFFEQLHRTNGFIDSLRLKTINLGEFDINMTYDAVHWTGEGNAFVYDKILESLS